MNTLTKIWSFFVLLIAVNYSSTAQTYNVPSSGNNTVSACSGAIYDHAGPNSFYAINANGTTVMTPATAGNYLRLSFTLFDVEACCDMLTIYDGNSTASPVIGIFTSNPGTIYATNTAGALTLSFTSDGSFNLEGFAATISCVATLPPVDLTIVSPTATPTSVVGGGTISASCSISNIGAFASTSSTVGYYLSTDNVWDVSDVLLNSSTGGTLNSGASASKSATLTIPAATPLGSYYIIYFADHLAAIAESDETNNFGSFQITVNPSMIDLEITNPTASPSSTPAGTSISASCTIRNTGNTSSPSSQVGYYLSTNTTWDSSDVYLNFSSGSTLGIGSSATRSSTLLIPGNTVPGSYYILYFADYANLTAEVNETNNVNSFPITVQASTVDLVINNPALGLSSVPAGTNTSASCTIQNIGNTQSSSSQVGYYLSTDNVWDISDVLLNSSTGNTLNAGSSSSRSATLAIPSSTIPGSYFVLYFADYANLVTETNENNNVNSVALSVVASSVDLIINSPSLSISSLPAGNSLTASCSIHNQGNTAAQSSQVGYYLSTDVNWDVSDVFLNSSSGSTLNGGSSSSKSSTLTIPSATTPGTYYILFFADYQNLTVETNESNNVNTFMVSVVLPTIDLTIQTTSANPTTIATGTSTSASCTIINSGNATASSSQVGCYLSTDAVWDINDLYLSATSGSSLNGGSTATRSATLTIPVGTAPGTYFLLFFVDYQNSVTETNETNNVSSTPVTIVTANVDLTILNPNATPTSIPQGTSVSLTCTISNAGNTSVSSSQVGYYLSTNQTWDVADTYLGASSGTTLAAGATSSKSATITMSTSVTPGSYYILYFADYQSFVTENDESNNVVSFAVTVTLSAVDLVIQNPSVNPSPAMQGSSLSISCIIKNQGNITSGSSQVGYYLSSDNAWDANDAYLGSSSGSSLTAGSSATRSTTVTLPFSTPAGTQYILCFADYLNSVTESIENNNVMSVPITVTQSTIDLVIQSPSANPATVAQGRTTSVSCTIANQGNTTATQSTVGYYLSTDNVWDANDTYLNSSSGSSLTSGNSATRSSTITIPSATVPGNYYILFFADYLNSVTETIESNNVNSLLITVNVATVDLLISGTSLGSTTIVQGSSFSGSCTISNQGNTASLSSGVGFYLSANNTWDVNDTYLNVASGSALSGGSSATRSATLTISTSVTPGNYYILFYADHLQQEPETNEANNVTAELVTVAAASIDLVIQNPSAASNSVPQGSSVSVSCTIRNQGNSQASSSQVGYYLSTDNNWDVSDTYLNFSSGSSLSGGSTATRSATVSIPGNTPVGTYYILFYADYQNSVSETIESNNVNSVFVDVVISAVDLTLQNPTVTPNSVANGASVSVSSTISNQGNMSASQSTVGYYLSTDAIWDVSDVYLGYSSGSTLLSGLTASRSATITIPSATSPGAYYLIFFADYQNAVTETSESNNYAVLPITVVLSAIDLTIQSPTVNPTSIPTGTSVSVSSTIFNQGNTSAFSSYVGYYLSTDQTWDALDTYLSYTTGGTLSAGSTATRSGTLSVPTSVASGSYYILFYADYQNSVSESIETNNVVAVPVTIVASTIDLVVSNASVAPTSIVAGSSVSVSSIIENQGNTSASSSRVGYYLSTNQTWDAGDTYITYSSGTTLAAGSSSTKNTTITISSSTPLGSYYLLFFGDYNGAVSESDETNNVVAVPITITTAFIDLTILTPSVTPLTVSVGGSVSVSCTIQNLGSTSASSSRVGYYLSANSTWDTGDTYITYSSGTTLAAGASALKSTSLSIPSVTSGTYYIIFYADYLGSVTESNESNNFDFVQITIATSSVDLVIQSPSASPSSVVAGGSTLLSCSLRNNGTSTASSSLVGFFLSADATWDGNDIYLYSASGGTVIAGGGVTRNATVSIPSSAVPGSYYILFYADYVGDVLESDETNNVSSTPVTIIAPDLIILTGTVTPSSAQAGVSINASYTISNQGSSTANSSSVGVYLSNNMTFEGSDVYLGNSSGGTLVNGTSDSRSLNVTIQTGTTPGSYYILFVADYLNSVAEGNENNNVYAKSFNVGASQTADLLTTNVSVSPDSATINGKVYVNYNAMNTGSIASNASTVGYYLSTDGVWGVNDQLLKSTAIASVAAGNTVPYSDSLNIPSSITPGDYFLLIYSDVLDEVLEADENNNVTSRFMKVVLPTGISHPEMSLSKVQLYPNPANDNLFVQLTTVKEGYGRAQVSLLNMLGQEVISQPVTINNDKQLIHLNTREVQSGVYLVRVLFENGKMLTDRVMIE